MKSGNTPTHRKMIMSPLPMVALLGNLFSVAHYFGFLWRISLAPQFSRDIYVNYVAHI
jgi:hypothetical protein